MENEEEDIKPEIISAKIGAVPTQTAWSQTYNAGSLFAILTLTKETTTEEDEEVTLSSIGKEVLDSLEKEYFTLEVKNLTSIKDAIGKTLSHIPTTIKSSLVIAVIPFSSSHDNILYVFICGKGIILLKREDKIGTILSSGAEATNEITSASGFLENNDLIILETQKFASLVSHDKLLISCGNLPPSEIAESLSPEIHEKQEGDTSAIIIKYTKVSAEKEIVARPKKLHLHLMKISGYVLPLINKISLPHANITHTKKMFLTISAVLAVILILSIFFAIKKKNDTKTQALFQSVYTLAEQKYNEGQSLLSLNKNVAKDDFAASEKILLDSEKQFKKDSKEHQKITELLQKVRTGLTLSSGIVATYAQKTDKDSSLILAYQIDTKAKVKILFVQDTDKIYKLSMQEVVTIDKTKGAQKTIIKNDNDWQGVDGFSVYLGNVYILDKQANQIIKFINTTDTFVKSGYFHDKSKQDLSNAVSMSIDGSVWILYKDGSIQQFTRGDLQGFKNPILDKPLTSASRIFTDVETNNLYILDQKNKRIVVIGKDGIFKSQYSNDILVKSKDMEVVEKNKTVYLLADVNVYKIELK